MNVRYEWTILRSDLRTAGPRYWLQDRWRVYSEKALLGIGRRMPRRVRYWATIVSCAEATQGRWSPEHPDSVSIMTMLKRVER